MTNKFSVLSAPVILGLSTIGAVDANANIEKPKYKVIKKSDGVELRGYAPHLVAEIDVAAQSMRQASRLGFMPLARYIFGNNRGSNKISMTAPVTMQEKPVGTKIAMTAPVLASESKDGIYTVRFSMPAKWTMETLPVPNNSEISLVQLGGQRRVVYRFIGSRSISRISQASAKISAFLDAEKLESSGAMIVAGYDGPNVPIAMRRWEVMRIVK